MDLIGDATDIVISFVPAEDLGPIFAVSSSWAENYPAQHRFHMDRLAARIVYEVRQSQHNVRVEHEEQKNWPTSVVEEPMKPELFNLLFGEHAVKGSDSYELQFSKPRDILNALPSLPIAVRNVLSNAPALPLCPLTCYAGYMDGHVRYSTAESKLTFTLRSRVIKVAAYWERSLENLWLPNYPDI